MVKNAVKDVLRQAVDQNTIVGAVCIVSKQGKPLFHGSVGFFDKNKKKIMPENAIFRLSSVTKIITSLATAVLIQQNKLGLDEPITTWLPYFKPRLHNGKQAQITIRQLLSHTAGLSYGFFEDQDGPYHKAGVSDGMDCCTLTLEENLVRLSSVPLLYSPGTSWGYSLATDVLGGAISNVMRCSLAESLNILVLTPLKLKDTSFFVTDTQRLAPHYHTAFPNLLRMREEETIKIDTMSIRFSLQQVLTENAYPSGGAGMAGTASDIHTLLEVMRNGGSSLIEEKTMVEMVKNQTKGMEIYPGSGFGLGWQVLLSPERAGTPQAVGTFSWGGVYGHFWFVDPINELSVLLLSNTVCEDMMSPFIKKLCSAIYRNIT